MLRRLFAHHFLNLFLCRHILAQLFSRPQKGAVNIGLYHIFVSKYLTLCCSPTSFRVNGFSVQRFHLAFRYVFGWTMFFYLPLRWIAYDKINIILYDDFYCQDFSICSCYRGAKCIFYYHNHRRSLFSL